MSLIIKCSSKNRKKALVKSKAKHFTCPPLYLNVVWNAYVDPDDYCLSGYRGLPEWSWYFDGYYGPYKMFSLLSNSPADSDWYIHPGTPKLYNLPYFVRYMSVLVYPGSIEPDEECPSWEELESEWISAYGANHGNINQLNGAPYPGYPPHELIQETLNNFYDEPYPYWCA